MNVERHKTALLVLDVQQGVVDAFLGDPSYVDRVVPAIEGARGCGMPVIFVRLAFRPDYTDVSSSNRAFSGVASPSGTFLVEHDASAQIHRRLGVRPDDLVVVKKRASSFAGTDLELILRSQGIEHLVLLGIVTSGGVLATFCAAADLDYELTVLSDACADPDDEVHRMLIEKIFPQQAEVLSVAEWLANGTTPTSA